MTDTKKLDELITESGFKRSYPHQRLGLTSEGFRKKLINERPFTVPEVETLCEILGIKSIKQMHEIFFNKKVGKGG